METGHSLMRAAVLAGVFAFGAAIGLHGGTREIVPLRDLAAPGNPPAPEVEAQRETEPLAESIATNLLRLKKVTYNRANAAGLGGFGGGLVMVRGNVLGVDRSGTFFIYRSPGIIRTMSLRLDMNTPEFVRYLQAQVPDELTRAQALRNHRVLGIAARDTNNEVHLFVSHYFWHSGPSAKSFRISRLIVRDVATLLAGRLEAAPPAGETIYESTPLIEFSLSEPSPFTTNHSGGRMVFDPEGRLFVGIGDHRFDGVAASHAASQDDTSSYGKILMIDPNPREVLVYARGIRNPQGLMIDRDGTLWETEHGPKGGDELNRIVEGENYGWPWVTYGTDDNVFEWPLSKRQGRHEGYAAPIYSWIPSIGISNLIQVNHAPAAWDGDFLVSSLNFATLFRVRITEGRVVFAEPIRVGERVRDLVQMADGAILLWLDSGHFIELHEVPAGESMLPVPLTADEQERGLGRILNQCAGCHEFGPAIPETKAPRLWGVLGRKIGESGFRATSDALKAKQGAWNETSLKAFLSDPQAFAPGTNMPGVPMDAGSMDAVVAYLKRLRLNRSGPPERR